MTNRESRAIIGRLLNRPQCRCRALPICFAGVRFAGVRPRRRSGEPAMAWKILSPISVQIKSLANVRHATAEAQQR
jgi:hypothetical protein